MSEKIAIYDISFLKNLTLENLKGDKNVILYDDYEKFVKNQKDFLLNREQLQNLITEGKLKIESIPSLYKDISYHDKIIYLAILKGITNDITVYTESEKIAIDLIINNISVENHEKSDVFINIGKSTEKNEVYFYDTCSLIELYKEIDFSKNTHYITTCVLEELMRGDKKKIKESVFFNLLYILNKYKENVKIISTSSYTQGGGRYSYTDLLILYNAIRANTSQKITFVTQDNQLYFEAIALNLFKVVSNFDYITSSETTKEIESDSIIILKDTSNDDELLNNESMEVKLKKDDSNDTVLEDKKNYELNEEITEEYDILEYEPKSDKSIVDLKDDKKDLQEKVKMITNDYNSLPVIKINKLKFISSELVCNVYNGRFAIVPPYKKCAFPHITPKYKVSVGFFVSFVDNPEKLYKIIGITSKYAHLLKI